MLLNAYFGVMFDLKSDSWSLYVRFRQLLPMCWTRCGFRSFFWCMDLVIVWIFTLCRIPRETDCKTSCWFSSVCMKSRWCCNESGDSPGNWDLLGSREKILRSPGRRLPAWGKGWRTQSWSQVAAWQVERDWERDYRLRKGSSEPGIGGGPKASWELEGTVQSCLHCKVTRLPERYLERRICH